MADLRFSDLTKAFDGGTRAVDSFDLDIADGEFMVLVGPSGSGKTTVLRLTAGLEEVTKGEIAIGGRVVNHLHPTDRDIAMVFQNYALYPHMTVAENMGFGLKLRRTKKSEIKERVNSRQFASTFRPLSVFIRVHPWSSHKIESSDELRLRPAAYFI